MTEIEYRLETDWLNTSPVFINTKTCAISKNISDVIDWGSMEFDNEGLSNYLRFGYTVFNKTPIKNVEKLPPNTVVVRRVDASGKPSIDIKTNYDPVLYHLDRKSSPEECLEILKKSIHNLVNSERASGKKLLLPLSGGYDSRIILSMIEDKSRIQAMTYDISLSGQFSSEMIYARILCQKFGINWEKVDVKNYWGQEIVRKNFSQFGVEMSLQPAYHIEMFEIAKKRYGDNCIAVSGSVGDWWSGEKLPLYNPTSLEQCLDLFHTIGIAIPSEYIEIKSDKSYNESCIQPIFDKITESYIYRTVFSKRGRIGLASFINRIPDSIFGSLTPFYDIDVAMSQLALPPEQRKDRKWQSDYFSQMGIYINQQAQNVYSISINNSLDLIAASVCISEMQRINPSFFDGIVSKSRIEWINRCLDSIAALPVQKFIDIAEWTFKNDNSKINPPASRNGTYLDRICGYLMNSRELNEAINEWSILMPLQLAIQKAQSGEY